MGRQCRRKTYKPSKEDRERVRVKAFGYAVVKWGKALDTIVGESDKIKMAWMRRVMLATETLGRVGRRWRRS